jgi:hypothetical protein
MELYLRQRSIEIIENDVIMLEICRHKDLEN